MKLRIYLLNGLLAVAAFFGHSGFANAQNWHPACYGDDLSRYTSVKVTFTCNDPQSWYQSGVNVNGTRIAVVGNGSPFGPGVCRTSDAIFGRTTSLSFTADHLGGTFAARPWDPTFSGDCHPVFEDSHTNEPEGYINIYVGDLITPSLYVSKSASTPYLAVGASGQYYTISISVSDGPTTQAISLSDNLPTGITVAGPITASGGTLSGCPGVGATSLSGCSIAAGTYGVTITVPVNIASNASSHAISSVTNTAYASGGGSTNCASGCSGSTTNAVINAIDDTATKLPGVPTSTDVSVNDVFPSGSTFTAIGGSCANISPFTPTTNTTGVLNYTLPASTASCTVNYQLCAPAPYNTVCDTATLTVTPSGPSVTVRKALGGTGRFAAGDQFTVQILRNGVVLNDTTNSTTTGSGSTVTGGTGTTGNFSATANTSYTINELGSNGTDLTRYNSSVTCTVNGTQQPAFSLGGSITPTGSDVYDCVITNAPGVPLLTVTKALAGTGRVHTGDQFTVQILRNGTVVNSITNSTTTGTGATVDPNTGTTLQTALVAGTQYVISEVGSNGTQLLQYTATLACTDATGASRTLPLNAGFTLQSNDVISCKLTNTPALAKLTIQKTTPIKSGTFTFLGSSPNANGFSTNGSYTITTTTSDTPTSGGQVTLTANNTTTDVREALKANWLLTAAICKDGNRAATGNPEFFGSLAAQNQRLRIPDVNVLPGADLQCVFIDYPVPRLTLTKVTTVGTGTFVFTGTADANGFPTDGSYKLTTTTPGVGVSGPAINLATANVATEVLEAVQPNWVAVSAACNDLNYLKTGNPAPPAVFGTIVNNILRIEDTYVLPGADIYCTITNAPAAAKLTIKKLTTVGTGDFTFNGVAPNANGFPTSNNYTVSTTVANQEASGTTVSLTASHTRTDIKETVPPTWRVSSAICTDNNGFTTGTFGHFDGISTLQIDPTNVLPGSDLRCLFTNSPNLSRLTVRQIVLSPVPPDLLPPFRQDYTGTNGWGPQTVTNNQLNTFDSSSTLTVGANNTQTTVSTILPDARWFTLAFTCVDNAASVSGNPTGVLASGTGPSVTISAANVLPGADLVCSLVLGHVTP